MSVSMKPSLPSNLPAFGCAAVCGIHDAREWVVEAGGRLGQRFGQTELVGGARTCARVTELLGAMDRSRALRYTS